MNKDKEIDSMSERELLCELVRQGRRAERAERIKLCALAVLLAAVVVLALVFVPKIVSPVRQLSESMGQIEASFDEARRVLESFDDATLDRFKQTMESLNETSQQARALMDKLRDSGIDKLQPTIEGLNNSISSFLRLFRGLS